MRGPETIRPHTPKGGQEQLGLLVAMALLLRARALSPDCLRQSDRRMLEAWSLGTSLLFHPAPHLEFCIPEAVPVRECCLTCQPTG